MTETLCNNPDPESSGRLRLTISFLGFIYDINFIIIPWCFILLRKTCLLSIWYTMRSVSTVRMILIPFYNNNCNYFSSPGVDLKDKFLDRQTLTDICLTKAASRFARLISQLFL